MIYQCTDTNPCAALAGAGLVAIAVPMYEPHILLHAEALFVSLALTALWALGQAVQQQYRSWLVLAGIAAGLGFATRYVGVTLVLTGGLAVLLFSRHTWRRRVLDGMLFGGLAVLPVSLWLLRNALVQGRATTSTLGLYPIEMKEISWLFGTLFRWLVPVPFTIEMTRQAMSERGLEWLVPSNRYIVAGVALAIIGSVVLTLVLLERHTPLRLRERTRQQPVLSVLAAFALIYIAFVVFARGFLYVNISFNTRILILLFPVLVIWGSVLAYAVWHNLPRAGWLGWARRAVMFGCVLLLLVYGLRATFWLRACYTGNGCNLGYNSPVWRNSETIAAIRALPDGWGVYTNDPFAVHFLTTDCCHARQNNTNDPFAVHIFLTNDSVKPVPYRENLFTGHPNPTMENEIAAMQAALEQGTAVLAYFDLHRYRYMMTIEELEAAGVRLRLLQDTADGALYVAE